MQSQIDAILFLIERQFHKANFDGRTYIYDENHKFHDLEPRIETKLMIGFQLQDIRIRVSSLENLTAATTSCKNHRLVNAFLFPAVSTTYEESGRNALVTKLAECENDECFKRFKCIYFDNYPLTFKQELIVYYSLRWLHQKSIERKITNFLRLKRRKRKDMKT